jgi:hypothetical protein
MAALTASAVADYLRQFLDGEGGDWDWDDFTSAPIADPVLENIRVRALNSGPPFDDQAMIGLRELLAEAEALR